MDGIRHLKMISLHQILVTNEVFSDGTVYGEETQRYLRILGTVNACLARQADHVTEVVYGIPVSVK
jgi:adenosylcobinamide kinase/adenosylcobinamide-phosphate guanylyltransferase